MRRDRARRGARWVRLSLALGLVAAASPAAASAGSASDAIARGDVAWSARAEGASADRAGSDPVLRAVAEYSAAIAHDPDSWEARWKALRGLHFAGDFAASNPAEARDRLDRATLLAEQSLDLLARRAGDGVRLERQDGEVIQERLAVREVDPHDVARIYFWSAVNWGAWSRSVGLVGAVREGVANRLHDYTQVTIALEPEYEEGGAFRLLGGLHAELPRVPFLTGWVDRDRAVPLIERAHAMAPDHPGNRMLLALTLLDLEAERRAEAIDLLETVADLEPRPSMRVEDLAIRDSAREELERERERSS